MNNPSAQPKLETVIDEQAAGIQSADARNLKDDPRDMFFTLPNWSEIWENTPKGSSIYTSDYPGGTFKTEEGYEFELRIYPQVQGSASGLPQISVDLFSSLSGVKRLYPPRMFVENCSRVLNLQLIQFQFMLTKSEVNKMN